MKRRGRIRRLFHGLAVLALAAAPARAAESWEGKPLSAAQRAACRTLPRALVRPVGPGRRAEAAALLGSAPAVMLGDAQAAEWIDIDAPPSGALSQRLLKDATDAMHDRRDTSIGEHALKWSASEQFALDALLQMAAAPPGSLRPVLVRAVAGYEATGAFDAAVCGDGLAIRHLYREAGTPTPELAPVIVFVERPPAQVQAWREVARP